MNQSPKILVNFALLLAAVLLLVDLSAILYPPYTGFNLAQDPVSGSMRVSRLDDWVARSGLQPGDEVITITNASGLELAMGPQYFQTTSYGARQYFASRSERINAIGDMYDLLRHSPITLALGDGRNLELALSEQRPLSSLSAKTWALIFLGISVPILASLVWAWHPDNPEAVFLLLSGIGFYFINFTGSVSIYGIEMFYPPVWLHWLSRILLDIGQLFFATFGTAVLLFYPNRLRFAAVSAKLITLFAIAYPTLIYSVQAITYFKDPTVWPGFADFHTYFYMFPFFAGVIYLCWLQFRASRNYPVQKAQTLWILLAWTAGPGLYLLLRAIPVLLDQPPLLDNGLALNGIISTTYFMVLIGIARFNLFQLEQHIGQAYQWVLVSLGFFGLDLFLLSVTNLSPSVSAAIVLAAVLWGYLPIRHWLHQQYVVGHQSRNQMLMNEAVIQMVQNSLDTRSRPGKIWKSVLDLMLKPVSIKELTVMQASRIEERGQQLIVSANKYSPPLQLEFAENGSRLFKSRDLQLVNTLSLLFEKLYDVRDAYLAGQTQERSRIRRDLHDQIGHKLLSLIYSAPDARSRSLAQETMSQLSELIQALKQEPVSIDDLAVRIHTIVEDTCKHANLALEWKNDIGTDSSTRVNSDQYLNILNIVRELLNNTVKHSEATLISLSLHSTSDALTLIYKDNGTGFDQGQVKPGNGLFNLQLRASELNARLDWETSGGTLVKINIPVATGEAEHD